ncbi:hypothetical protein PHYSODRAFT_339832 [Phytophthora sojae]|uniref:Uncharacterized protein n=1 Tax=Phytophthora sojae (strain P6497) TaxID=1094619 RepID=G5A7S4_PHYSP|nr:hypothetical protein PHYSODRAFT_339832 [Phytophthora sojae]EGZ07950.1 hypothetical protein PHYSODRAFT_339832 [Phytophthora sojae]|eukprot:XP_009536122.1 hypothetical protein PHYSODRAFT_339832 [Phytophthora sojae]
MFTGTTLPIVVALAALASSANAHGYLEEPSPTWVDSPNPEWIVNIDNYWDIGSGGDQCGLFKTMTEEKGVTVKDVVLEMVNDDSKNGGFTHVGPCEIYIDNTMVLHGDNCEDEYPGGDVGDCHRLVKWLGNGGGGFTHVGPCEVYIDDKMVAHGDNCEDEFKGGDVGSKETSDIPADYSSCNGKCTLTMYWLAFQNEQWETVRRPVRRRTAASSTGEQKAQFTQDGSQKNQDDKDNKNNDDNQNSSANQDNEEE